MGKFKGVLLASDFDDTLYCSHLTAADSPERVESDSGTGPILSPENQAALEYFVAEGGHFSVATGRSRRTFQRYVGRLPMSAPAVLSNGSVIYDFNADKEIFRANLRPRIVSDMLTLAAEIPALGFEVQFDQVVCIYRPNEITWRHLHRLGLDHVECPLEEMPQPWCKLVVQGDHETLVRAQTYMNQRWSGYYEPIFSNSSLLEVTPKGCTKGEMVLKVAGMLGVKRENLYCVGDNQNDLTMLQISAVPFAPANCAQELKAWGAVILRSCEDNCIAQLIGILDKRYR